MAIPWHWLQEDGTSYWSLEEVFSDHWILEESPTDTHDIEVGGFGPGLFDPGWRKRKKRRFDEEERPQRAKRISIMEKYGFISQEMPDPDEPVTTNLLRAFLPKPPKMM